MTNLRKGYSITLTRLPRQNYLSISIPVHDIMPTGDRKHYSVLRQHIKNISCIVFETIKENGKDFSINHFVNDIDTEKGLIYLTLHEKIWQAMLDFSKGYRYYDISKTFTLNSAYSVRFYLLLAGQKQPMNFTLDSLRKMLALGEKYKNGNHLIQNVVEKAKKELDQKMPYSFTYTTEKKKSNRSGKPAIESITLSPVHIQANESEKKVENELKKRITMFGFDQETATLLYNYYGFTTSEIQNNYDIFMLAMKNKLLPSKLTELKPKASRAKNTKGYIIQALKNILSESTIDLQYQKKTPQ